MDTQPEIPQSDVIDQMVEWIHITAIFRAALDLQVWEKVAAGEDTAMKMASTHRWEPIGTRLLLDALCALKLLTKQGSRYSLVPEAAYYLLPSLPTYKGNLIQAEFSWEGNGKLAESIRTGKRPVQYNAASADMVGMWIADYARGWAYPRAFLQAAEGLCQSLDIVARDGLRILDVACGPAPKTLALARQHPGVRLTLLDFAGVLQAALQAATSLGVEQQVTLLPGDLWSLDFGGNKFDVVWLGNITHFFSPEENLQLFKKVHLALAHKGMVVVNLFDRRERQLPAWVELWFYAVSANGAVYSFDEYRWMLEDAGFTRVQDINHGPIKAIRP